MGEIPYKGSKICLIRCERLSYACPALVARVCVCGVRGRARLFVCFLVAEPAELVRSKSEIRYEGTLFAIDTKDSTVTLQNGAPLSGGTAPVLRVRGIASGLGAAREQSTVARRRVPCQN